MWCCMIHAIHVIKLQIGQPDSIVLHTNHAAYWNLIHTINRLHYIRKKSHEKNETKKKKRETVRKTKKNEKHIGQIDRNWDKKLE